MSCLEVTCWALMFIFKVRFPTGISIATILKNRFQLGFNSSSGCLVNFFREFINSFVHSKLYYFGWPSELLRT